MIFTPCELATLLKDKFLFVQRCCDFLLAEIAIRVNRALMCANMRRLLLLLLSPDHFLVSGGSRRIFRVIVAVAFRRQLRILLGPSTLLGGFGRSVEKKSLVKIVGAEVAVLNVEDRTQPGRHRGRVGGRGDRREREHIRAGGKCYKNLFFLRR